MEGAVERIRIGRVARPHGVRGELRIQLDDEGSTVLFDVERVWIGGEERVVAGARPTNAAVLLTIEGIEDRDAADLLKGKDVEVLREDVPLEDGEYFVSDLIGCEVVDEQGAVLGRAVKLLHGGQDLLVIHDEARGIERILPVIPEFILSVDRATRRVVVSPPEGLPEEPIGR
jgi:16S rRNA processing protein RimM